MYENSMRGVTPSNNLWVGNNYSSGYSQMSRSNYPAGLDNMQSQYGMPQTINNILQVMGPESAQSYQVGPNSHVILMDSNRPVFYTKKSDDSGYSVTKAFEFKEIPLFQEPVEAQNVKIEDTYVTKEEFNKEFKEFKAMIEDLVMKNE